MKFKTFKQNKLVRDKIVEAMQERGSKMYWLTLSDLDFIKQLKIKLLEEAHEVAHANNQAEVIEEMADLVEVLQTLMVACNVKPEELETIQKKKREEKGGFEKRIFVTFAEHPKDSPQERYCLADPEKYPIVKQ